MKVLIVCSGNFPEPEKNFSIHQAFIYDQIQALNKYNNVSFDIYLIKGRGIIGYLLNIGKLRKRIKNGNYDLIHAHYCLSGLISIIASPIKVVTTFHGSDINKIWLNILSSIYTLWSDYVIYVSNELYKKALIKAKKSSVIPCGVDLDIFYSNSMNESKNKYISKPGNKLILFSSSFRNKVKNYPLAEKAISIINNPNIEIIQLEGYTRSEVSKMLSIADIALMTSYSEGSPQFIKEAMACNCPIVSTNVGDVNNVIGDTEGCFVSSFDPNDVAFKINEALQFAETKKRTSGREKIIELRLDNKSIAKKIFEVYNLMLEDKK